MNKRGFAFGITFLILGFLIIIALLVGALLLNKEFQQTLAAVKSFWETAQYVVYSLIALAILWRTGILKFIRKKVFKF